MNIVKKWAARQFIRKTKPYFKSFGLFKTHNFKSALVWEPKNGNVLVLAPHPDDEVIGCGGTIHKHVHNGANVTVVYMTDGRHGSSALLDASDEKQKILQQKLIETRKREAELCMQTLGIQKGIFLDSERITLSASGNLSQQIRKIIRSFKPDLVYLPFFWEEQSDHRAANQILLEATDNSNFRFNSYFRNTWFFSSI